MQIGQGAEEVRAAATRIVEHTWTGQTAGPSDGEAPLEEFGGEPDGKGRVAGPSHEHTVAGVVGVIAALAGKSIAHSKVFLDESER